MTDILIIGQGICGTFLSWELERAGVSFLVIDEPRPFSASRVAAGLINPVTGRRIVKTWMIDELLPFALEAYGQMGTAWGIPLLRPASVVDFFPTVQMRLAFLERYGEDPQYLRLPEDEHAWDDLFRYELGYGTIEPCYLVDMPALLEISRKRMLAVGLLMEERFEREELVAEESGKAIRYKDIHAKRVIFCDGIESCGQPLFFAVAFCAEQNGEALIVEIPELVGRDVFKKGISLVPWKEDLYWAGSSYEWSFSDDQSTQAFRDRTEAILRDLLKVPFNIVDHFASVRPATLERRPFVGFHPLYPAIGIFNGMGTKGCSLAPFFAHQLVQHITQGSPIQADVRCKEIYKNFESVIY